jgi:hypothetical protein
MNKTIQQVGEMVGIPAKETDQILVQVRANTAKLEGCEGPHDFSIALDRYTKEPIANPTPQQHFGCKWQCFKCGGYVDAINKSWYNRGLNHAAPNSPTWPYVLVFAKRMEAKLAKNRHKGDREGWLKDHPWNLVERILDETVEVQQCFTDAGSGPQFDDAEKLANECADVANFCMMVADRVTAQEAGDKQ